MNVISYYFKTMGTRIRTMSLVFILILIELYFLVNGEAHFENWSGANTQIITIYILMVVTFMIFHGRETEREMNVPIVQGTINFVMFFIATYFLMLLITTLSGSSISPMDKSLFWPSVILQVCVIATSEELMFRGVLLEKFGILLSSFLFALWHSYAYGIQYYDLASIDLVVIIPFIIAFLMGIILAFIVKRQEFGLPSAIAVHACYNLFVSGAFVTFATL